MSTLAVRIRLTCVRPGAPSISLTAAEVGVAGNAAHGHVHVGEGGTVEVLGPGLLGQSFRAALEHAGLELVLLRFIGTKKLGRLADPDQRELFRSGDRKDVVVRRNG